MLCAHSVWHTRVSVQVQLLRAGVGTVQQGEATIDIIMPFGCCALILTRGQRPRLVLNSILPRLAQAGHR